MKPTRLLIVIILLCNATLINSCEFFGDKRNTVSGENQNESSNSDTEDPEGSETCVEEENYLASDYDDQEQYDCGYRGASVTYVGNRIVLDNSIPFIYDTQSELTVDRFYVLTPPGVAMALSQLEGAYPIATAHENQNVLYTVYSLKDGKLAYVIIIYFPNTGTGYYVKDIVEYPYTSPEQEQKMWFLLPQDLPENILGNSQ
jgi:hypothetical protein